MRLPAMRMHTRMSNCKGHTMRRSNRGGGGGGHGSRDGGEEVLELAWLLPEQQTSMHLCT